MIDWNPKTCVVFCRPRDKWGELSNMHKDFPIEAGGLKWQSSEHLYQAAKFTDEKIQRQILQTFMPMEAKKVAYQYPHIRLDWEDVKIPIMQWCLELKFDQHEEFQRVLAETGNRKLWFFGHHHRSWKMDLCGCHFRCLNELEVAECTLKSESMD